MVVGHTANEKKTSTQKNLKYDKTKNNNNNKKKPQNLWYLNQDSVHPPAPAHWYSAVEDTGSPLPPDTRQRAIIYQEEQGTRISYSVSSYLLLMLSSG